MSSHVKVISSLMRRLESIKMFSTTLSSREAGSQGGRNFENAAVFGYTLTKKS